MDTYIFLIVVNKCHKLGAPRGDERNGVMYLHSMLLSPVHCIAKKMVHFFDFWDDLGKKSK